MKIFKNMNYIMYPLFFIISIVVNIFFMYSFFDGIAQYAMARAIYLGEIPYNDFNMVTTPLFPLIHSIFLFLSDSYLTFTIINSLIVTAIYYYCSKICPKYYFTIFLLLCLPSFYFIAPSYNLLAKLLILIIVYFEKEKKSDFSIGLLLGLLILTKHSIGVTIMICSFLYIRDLKRIFQRIKGMIIPLIIFFIYLLVTHSFYSFFDLTFLGLFSFGKHNTTYSYSIIGLFFIFLVFYLYDIFKNKNQDNYLTYYALGSLSFLIPIFDLNHFMGALLLFLLFLFTKYNIQLRFEIINFFLILIFLFLIVVDKNDSNIYSFNHYPLFRSSSNTYQEMNDVLYYYEEKYPNSVMISPFAALYDTISDKRITYFDNTLTGNYGYSGLKKMIHMLNDDTYYFIYKKYKVKEVDQFDIELCEYVIDHSQLVDSIGDYYIYYLDDK